MDCCLMRRPVLITCLPRTIDVTFVSSCRPCRSTTARWAPLPTWTLSTTDRISNGALVSLRPDRGGVVLVIDDSDISRAEMTRVLEGAGMQVMGLASPIGATRVILGGNVRAVVIDVEMPSLRGDRLAALFRGNPRMNGVGVVLVSGDTSEELARLATEARADASVSKTALSKLPDAVRRAIAKVESWRPRDDA